VSDDGNTLTCDLCGKAWDMTNPIHKVEYNWHQLPATALYQQFPAMAEAIDKLIEPERAGASTLSTPS
jgi:hypothetical protein